MSDTATSQAYVDLHVHTTWSDGRWDPATVVFEAAERGLAAIAITDHDVVGGLADAGALARAAGVELIPGVELTADWEGRTVHMLGYGIDPQNPPLLEALERGRGMMAGHVDRVLTALAEAGEPIEMEKLSKYRARYAGGASLVLAMVEGGVLRRAKNGRELLRLASLEPRAYSAEEAIGLIHAAGGVAVLAHPARIRAAPGGAAVPGRLAGTQSRPTEPGATRASPLHAAAGLRPLVEAGLDGIEAWNIVHGQREREHYATVSRQLGLLITGGSDCHGPRRGYAPRMGSQQVPYDVLMNVQRAIDSRRGAAPA